MDLQDYLNEAYSALYQIIPDAFPEFEFQLTSDSKGYKSNNYLKIDGSTGEKKGAVYIYADNFYGFKDYTRGFISIYNYLQQRDNIEHDGILKKIEELSGIPLPKKTLNNTDNEQYKNSVLIAELLEVANSFFIDALSHPDNSYAHSEKAKTLRNYLLKERGYYVGHLRLPEQIYNHHKPQMELGFMPGISTVKDFLRQNRFSEELIENYLKIPTAADYTHFLTIPYRNKVGMIKGFTFRSVTDSGDLPKYLYSTGLERGSILFNLRSNYGKIHDLILTEGVLDALNASAHGLLHTAAVGGADLTSAQVQEIVRIQPKRITLLFDNDEAGKKGILRAIQKLLPYSQTINIYLALLPENCKDLDEFLRKEGVEKAKIIIQHAVSVGNYLAQNIKDNFYLKTKNQTETSDKAVEDLLTETIETEIALKNPVDAAIFRKSVSELLEKYAIEKQILDSKAEEVQRQLIQKNYKNQLIKLQQRISKALQSENISEAENLFDNEYKKIKTELNSNQYTTLLQTQTEDQLKEAIRKIPQGFYSGYDVFLGDKKIPIPLPNGAISFFCAPTSHGKTSMLINLALNIATLYPDKQVHFFSYEEAQEPITIKTLNTFTDKELSINNFETLEKYFATDDLSVIDSKQHTDFTIAKNTFFKDLIESGRLNIHYIDFSSENLIEAIHFLHLKNKADIIFVDYMQLLQISEEKKMRLSRQEELKKICIDLKDCAVKTGLPLVLGAQFNREVVNQFKIHSTKIGEAGDIERIASVIVGMWNNNFEPSNLTIEEEMRLNEFYKADTIMIKLLKNRNGRVGGHALLNYNGNRGKIYPNQQTQNTNQINTINSSNTIKF
jgi:DNA primase catalytic core